MSLCLFSPARRKQKWSVDPRNSAWSNDDSKFGQKMLERMGWSKGKGLGRGEQGSTEHIKVKVKNDSFGLGANASHEDKWIAHQDDFNDLLAHLNSCHGQNGNNDPPPEEEKVFSLEEKSKTAKRRVHYMKFTKGKDLSSRSEKDLNCIFGKRAHSSKEQEQESNSSESQDEKEETTALASSELDTETITNTVTSTMTMQEYFAQRMARLNKPQGQAQRPQTSEMSARSGESSPSHLVDNSSTRQLKIKKKKKDKRAADVAEEKCDAPLVIECEDPEQVYSEKKKRKKEKRKMHNDEQFLAPEETPPSKKKKAKKHENETEPVNGLVSSADQNVESEVVVKQEKKHVVQEDTGVEKKSKKKRKNRVETK